MGQITSTALLMRVARPGRLPRVVIKTTTARWLAMKCQIMATVPKHLDSLTSTLAPWGLARPGWFPWQANLPLLGGWLRTWKICHWLGNAKSTVRKARPAQTQHKTGSPWENWWIPTTSQLHFFALHRLYLGPVPDPASWQQSQSCSSYAAFAVELGSQMS